MTDSKLATFRAMVARNPDNALARLSEGTYGTCEGCGKTIASERLRALPFVSTCTPCAA